MDVLHPRCCGLDVHKSSISACILLREAGRVQKHQRRCGAMTPDLHELAEWLRQFGVTQVAMESSGVYWKPVWNILERQFTVVLANAQHIKNVPGRKTDQKDAEWIAQLLQYGLLRASYIPCEIIRDLRDLTRMRTSLSQEASRISSRIQKVLEDANVKLASVATNVLGKSGRAMLVDIINGEDSPEHLASLALGHLRVKIPQLRLALARRKDSFPSSLSASAFTGSNPVCGTRNCIARRTPGGHRPTKTGPGASGGSLG
ncbi:MAG: IS110 family transposase, partial [Candidatus Sulfotelmatobacter sp.]